MENYVKILVLNDMMEANRMEAALNDEDIPFNIISYHDYAYDGLFQLQKGWGHIEAPSEYEDKILEIYKEIGNLEND
ncbi:MAG: hypothetical protein FXF47_07195 [Candidatus Mcinerneyibacterium aminivorans]|jgi:hypothetical protein|uniref:DUF2007 domain-containing protein n=1 Tax=Candidatus Mcinerneyibacterium aminivorans TaxID=2703815 RepID=A0A5D0MFZ1_9BACT|nr:MAG: hypothetical protein FXF47_07195 [Candidatus Mcinerneyibacterium aminivorans]